MCLYYVCVCVCVCVCAIVFLRMKLELGREDIISYVPKDKKIKTFSYNEAENDRYYCYIIFGKP